MRLFIAIRLNEEMENALLDMQDGMRWKGVRGNYTKPENLHLTLAFIGEYSDPYHVKDVIESVGFEPFSIRLDGAGSFRGLWWAGVKAGQEAEEQEAAGREAAGAKAKGRREAADPLAMLVRRLRHALSDEGIPFDRKKFSPHITLVRRPDPDDIAPPPPERCSMTVDHISLKRSERGKGGMIYTEL